jgi:hypothetical protein
MFFLGSEHFPESNAGFYDSKKFYNLCPCLLMNPWFSVSKTEKTSCRQFHKHFTIVNYGCSKTSCYSCCTLQLLFQQFKVELLCVRTRPVYFVSCCVCSCHVLELLYLAPTLSYSYCAYSCCVLHLLCLTGIVPYSCCVFKYTNINLLQQFQCLQLLCFPI